MQLKYFSSPDGAVGWALSYVLSNLRSNLSDIEADTDTAPDPGEVRELVAQIADLNMLSAQPGCWAPSAPVAPRPEPAGTVMASFDLLGYAKYTLYEGKAPGHPPGDGRHGRHWWVWDHDTELAEESGDHFATAEEARADAISDLVAMRWDQAVAALGLDEWSFYSPEDQLRLVEEMLRGEWLADRKDALLRSLLEVCGEEGKLLGDAGYQLQALGRPGLAGQLEQVRELLREAQSVLSDPQPPSTADHEPEIPTCRMAA